MKLDYYRKYNKIDRYKPSQHNPIKMSDQYSNQWDNAISPFSIIVNSSRANTIYKNGEPYKCLVDFNKKLGKSDFDPTLYREIRTKLEDNFQVGDAIDFENYTSKTIDTYILLKGMETTEGYNLFHMQKTNNTLTYQHPTTLEIKTIPCILTDKSSIYSDGLKTGVITLQDDQIAIKVPFHEDVVNLPLKKRFIFDNSVVYQLTDIDRLTQKGLLSLTMVATQKSEIGDRFDLNIADYVESNIEPEPPEPTEIVISGDSTIKLNQTNTYTVDSVSSILFWLKSDDGLNDTTFAQIVEQGDNVCKIKASGVSANVNRYFRLYASDGVSESYIRIMIRSLF